MHYSNARSMLHTLVSYQMMQAACASAANIHAWALAHRIQTLQDL